MAAGLNTNDLIGKTEEEAAAMITRAGYAHQVYRRDGKVMDYPSVESHKKKVVLELNGGKVVRATNRADTQDNPPGTDQAVNA